MRLRASRLDRRARPGALVLKGLILCPRRDRPLNEEMTHHLKTFALRPRHDLYRFRFSGSRYYSETRKLEAAPRSFSGRLSEKSVARGWFGAQRGGMLRYARARERYPPLCRESRAAHSLRRGVVRCARACVEVGVRHARVARGSHIAPRGGALRTRARVGGGCAARESSRAALISRRGVVSYAHACVLVGASRTRDVPALNLSGTR